MSDPLDFLPTAPWEHIRRCAEIVAQIRAFFDQRDFIEVMTPLLSQDTVVDRYVEPFRVTVFADPRDPASGPTWYLQTSPEFHMKRLLVAGAPAIYQITHAFRAAEIGPHHNIEFGILEWYRTGDDLHAAVDFLAEFVELITGAGPTERISYQDAFHAYAGLNPFSATLDELQRQADGFVSDERDDLLDWILNQQIVPNWPAETATIIYDYPVSQAALAAIRQEGSSPARAERFELYWRGTELANGYHESCSADELRRRFGLINQRRVQGGCQPLPVESRLLRAMQAGLPPCSGVALGLDRLVMSMLGESTFSQVALFPADRA